MLLDLMDAKVPVWKVAVGLVVCGVTFHALKRYILQPNQITTASNSSDDDDEEDEVVDGQAIKNNYSIANGKFKMVTSKIMA